ncbi:MAG: hypothetical protein ABW133_07315 [Polyangiaceae bacterium]
MKTKVSFGMALCGLVAATALVTGCGSDSNSGTGTGGAGGSTGGAGGTGGTTGGTGGTSGGACTSGNFPLIFSPVYSAFDGTNTYQVPVIAYGITDTVKWTSSDPDAVYFDADKVDFGDAGPNPGRAVLITTRKAGTFTISASSGTACGSAQLTVTQATADEREKGNNRYNNGVPISFDGGRTPACNNCHGSTNPGGLTDVEHTPQQTGGYSDEELKNIFLKGQKPPGGGCRVVSCGTWSSFHAWDVSEEESKGIIFYLRSLAPKPQGGITFRPPGTGRDGG